MSSNNPSDRVLGPRVVDRSWNPDISSQMTYLNQVKSDIHPFVHDFMFSKIHYRDDITNMIKHAKLQPHEVVLDLGSGFGWAIKAAAPQCRFVAGVDINQLHITMAARYNEGIINHSLHCLDICSGPETFKELQLQVAKHMNPPSSTPVRFDVVFIGRTMRDFSEMNQRRILCKIREHLLTPGGRVVLVQELPVPATRTLEMVYGLEEEGYVKIWKYSGKEFVGDNRDLSSARMMLQMLAGGCGYTVESSYAFTDVQNTGYVDFSKEIVDAAKAINPTLGFVSHKMLEAARQQRMYDLRSQFLSLSQQFSDTDFKNLHAAVRSKKAAVIGILKPQA